MSKPLINASEILDPILEKSHDETESQQNVGVTGHDHDPIKQKKIIVDDNVVQLSSEDLIGAVTNSDLDDKKRSSIFAELSNRSVDQDSYATPQIVDTLLSYLKSQDSKISEETKRNAASALSNIASHENGTEILSTAENIDVIAKYGESILSEKEGQNNVAGLIANIARTQVGKEILGQNQKVRFILLKYADGSYEYQQELVEQVTAAIENITNDFEDKSLFSGDVETKNTLFAMAEKVDSFDAANSIARAIANTCLGSPTSSELYGGQDTKDVLMGLYKRQPKSVSRIAGAIVNVCFGNDAAREIYGDQDTHDMLINAANTASSYRDISRIAAAINNINCGDKNKASAIYGNVETRDAIMDMAKRSSNIDNDSIAVISSALSAISHSDHKRRSDLEGDDKKSPYSGTEVRDFLVEMSGKIQDGVNSTNRRRIPGKSSDEVMGDIARSIARITMNNKDAQETYATEEVASVIINMAEKISDYRDGGSIASAISNIASCEKGKALLCEGENALKIKSRLMKWAEDLMQAEPAEDEKSKKEHDFASRSIIKALEILNQTSHEFHGEDVKKTIFEMGRNAKGEDAVASVLNSISRIVNGNQDAAKLYSDEDTQKFLMDMVEKHPNSDRVKGLAADAICRIAQCFEGGERYCTPETKDMLLKWGNDVKSDDGIIGIANAIGNLAKYENAKSKSNVFAGQDVKDLLVKMKSRSAESHLENVDETAVSKPNITESAINRASNFVEALEKSHEDQQDSSTQTFAERYPSRKNGALSNVAPQRSQSFVARVSETSNAVVDPTSVTEAVR